MIRIRPAGFHDIDGIMRLEEEAFGSVSREAMASRETMISRIDLLNSENGNWFWIAEEDCRVWGYMIMQPTNINPDKCTSWSMATDDGRLIKTFDPGGLNLYGVSLAISDDAPRGIMELLMHVQFVVWIRGNHKYFFLCSRMPDYKKNHLETGVSPEKYWKMIDKDGRPYDSMLRYFSEYVGAKPVKFLPNGFPADPDSDGHGVLCVGDDPARALSKNIKQIHKSAVNIGWTLEY